MIKIAFLVSRHPELTLEQFRDHAVSVFLPRLKKLPGLKKLVVNFRSQIDGAGQTDIDAMAELWFDSMTEYQAAIHSPQGDAVRNDRHGFFDQARSRWMLLDELVVA